MGGWADNGLWAGEGLRREVFFFPSGGSDIYCSVYAAEQPSSSLGVLFCSSWGIEGNQASRLIHPTSIALAKSGGIAVHFHYPGFGDSQGSLETATIESLAEVGADALHEASRRYPEASWVLAGLMLGASVACLAAARGALVEHLLLIQPALSPGSYFARLQRAGKRALGELPPVDGFAFGYPLPVEMLRSAPLADGTVEAALEAYAGEGTVIAHDTREPDRAPERFERVAVPGAWRFGAQNDHDLNRAVGSWLGERVKAAA